MSEIVLAEHIVDSIDRSGRQCVVDPQWLESVRCSLAVHFSDDSGSDPCPRRVPRFVKSGQRRSERDSHRKRGNSLKMHD